MYENPDRIELYTPNDELSGFAIGPSTHTPNPHFIEHDYFPDTEAQVELISPDGNSQLIDLQGPTQIDVWFERREGEALDDDGNGLDEVMTKVVDLDLVGTTPLGPVRVRLNPNRMSTGIIEEKVNNTPGILDLPPFTATGAANSTFDLWLVIIVPGPNGPQRLFAASPKQMRSMITHKPPGPGDTYENPEEIELLDENGNPTGYRLGRGTHTPVPHFVEHDFFADTTADLSIINPQGLVDHVQLAGSTQVDVWFERREGEARDDDGDGRDEVMTKMVDLDLIGVSDAGLEIHVGLNPAVMSIGEIEERVNNTPGILDLPPFTATGTADSYFDVWLTVEVITPDGPLVLTAAKPKTMRSIITHKPPGPGDTDENPEEIPLLLPNGEPSGYSIGPGRHTPNPHFVEHDFFPETEAQVTLISPEGLEEVLDLRGPTQIDVWFENREGEARDDDGNGLDEVMTKVVDLDLRGTSSLGPVRVGLNPGIMSTGVIEEKVNNTPGILDLPPFTDFGAANSSFDLWLMVEVSTPNGVITLFGADPKIMRSMITHKPPGPGDTYENPDTIELVFADGTPSGFKLGPGRHVPNPHFVEHDIFEDTEAQINLITPTGESQTIDLRGPTQIDVWFENREGEAQDDDGDGLDDVMTKVVNLDLRGISDFGPVRVGLNPARMSTGVIEEKANNTPGILDIAPFAPTGAANSSFDIWLTVEVATPNGPLTLYAVEPKQMRSMITHKPPAIFEGYENPDTIPLVFANGEESGYALGPGDHIPRPHFVEHDIFESTTASVEIIGPNGSEIVALAGPTAIDVWFERREGEARDDDGNGLEEVMTKVVDLNLRGLSEQFGLLHVGLNPAVMSTGVIEELANNTPGVLDIPPFSPTGSALSWFDMWLTVEVLTPDGPLVLTAARPKHMQTTIHHKPPATGDTYESPEVIELLLPNGEPSGYSIGPGTHTPRPHFVEHDFFENTQAEVSLISPDGNVEDIALAGPTQIDVWFENREGEAQDDDGNGLDDVMTKVVNLDLRGHSSLGPVRVGLNPGIMSTGIIEEQTNNTPGVLDLPPFTATGTAFSAFNLWLTVEVNTTDGVIVLYAERPKRMESIITHKPPGIGDTYENPETIPLLFADGSPSGYSLGPGSHTPNPHFVEHDYFPDTEAKIDLIYPTGGSESIDLHGPTAIDVWFERREGEALDDDNNGLDDVMTKVVQLDLRGRSELGNVRVGLNPGIMSTGGIEELENANPGILDLPPFTESGRANSWFDIWLTVEVDTPNGRLRLFAEKPKQMRSVITHKPPGVLDGYENPDRIELLLPNGQPSGYALGPGTHVPRPRFVEHDVFPNAQAQFDVVLPSGVVETILVHGSAQVDVYFERREGEAVDNDGDQRDEVATQIVAMDMRGTSSFGPVHLLLNPGRPSIGVIEENQPDTPGILDLPPFTDGGEADSFFDVFFEVRIGDVRLLNEQPLLMETIITHKPPAPGETYLSVEPVSLYRPNGQLTEFRLENASFTPAPAIGGQIHGVKWLDRNGDGERGADEPGLGGWTIYLDENFNGQIDPGEPSTLTDETGAYWFDDVPPGEYFIGETLLVGDFDGSLSVDAADIDALRHALQSSAPDPRFDINDDGIVDQGDVDYLVLDVLGSRYGDFNLDHLVNGADFTIWRMNRFQDGLGWAHGDANGDFSADGRDFNLWNANKFLAGQPWVQTFPGTGPHAIFVGPGDVVEGIDFGNQRVPGDTNVADLAAVSSTLLIGHRQPTSPPVAPTINPPRDSRPQAETLRSLLDAGWVEDRLHVRNLHQLAQRRDTSFAALEVEHTESSLNALLQQNVFRRSGQNHRLSQVIFERRQGESNATSPEANDEALTQVLDELFENLTEGDE
ncbi:MAG: hypothetical protein KDA60_00720 [Planctomycetales bacterium]|nr:hypothetical protein [Planctomycetales bacterium]